MAGKLVTIARFDLAGQAHLAKNALDAAGIKSVLADEVVVAMDWLLSNAVGGIKVQVLEEDADRAVAALEEALGADTGPVDEETLAAEAEAAGSGALDADDPRERVPEPAPMAPAVPEPVSERDAYAGRAFLAAFFALAFIPLWFYALYLFFNAAFGDGPLSAGGRNKVFLAGGFLAIGLPTAFFVLPALAQIFP